jgi:gluconokinase
VHAKETIEGMSLATSSLEILRAGMEAVAYRVALVFDKLAGLLRDDIQIVAGGGALRGSALWLQMVTDVLGCEVNLIGVRETSARGASLLAFEALGLIEGLSKTPKEQKQPC